MRQVPDLLWLPAAAVDSFRTNVLHVKAVDHFGAVFTDGRVHQALRTAAPVQVLADKEPSDGRDDSDGHSHHQMLCWERESDMNAGLCTTSDSGVDWSQTDWQSQSSAWKRCVNDWYERGRNRSVKQSCYIEGALKPSSDPDSWNGPFLKATVGINSIRFASHDGGEETFDPSTSPELKVL